MARATERQICSNLWAYLHWLRATGRATLGDRASVELWKQADPEPWGASIRAFAGLPESTSGLLGQSHPEGTLVLRSPGRDGRRSWSTFALARGHVDGLPAALDGVLTSSHGADALTETAAFLLLDADLRPDDRVLLACDSAWPWAFALRLGATLIVGSADDAETLRQALGEENASILVGSRAVLAPISSAPGSLRLCIDAASREIIVFD